MSTNDGMTPPQQHGASKDLRHSQTMSTVEDAEELFLLAKERLLNVNYWKEISGGQGAAFSLTDIHGSTLRRHAHKGDRIRINIPGPNNASGEGDDWVSVEGIQYHDYPDDNGEAITMVVRPTSAPVNADKNVAHFFSDDATSTFNIQRLGRLVTAHYSGRNETPNTDTGNLLNDARNTLVAVGAILGGSAMQWGMLLQGFLKIPDGA